MEFNIGSLFVKIELRDTHGKIGKLTAVVPIGSNRMFALRAQITEDDIPLSSDQAIYTKGNKFAEEMVRGWIDA